MTGHYRRVVYHSDGVKLNQEQIAQILYQVGFRGDDLVKFTGLAIRESGGEYGVHGSDQPRQRLSGDMGLFQINSSNWSTVRQALGLPDNKALLFDPVINAQAAKVLFDRSGYFPWNMAPGGWTAGGNPMHGVNLERARAAVTSAGQKGLLGQAYSGPGTSGATAPPGASSIPGFGNALPSTPPTGTGSIPGVGQIIGGANGISAYAPPMSTGGYGGGYNPMGGGTVAPQAPDKPMTLPADAELFNNGFTVVAVFDVGGVKVGYDVDWTSGRVAFDSSKVKNIGSEAYAQMGVVDAGSAEELRALTFPTYKQFFESIVGRVMGYSNPARNSPDVLKVLAEFASRPDMTAAELQNRLQATEWYQQRTTSELEWNSLSEAEKTKRRDQTASQMAQAWFQFSGEDVSIDDPRVQDYLEDVASGKVGFGAWTEKVVKAQSEANPESPWSRTKRDEVESQRARGIDIENTAQRVKELARRWGVQWSEETFQHYGRQIAEKVMSDADVLFQLKTQAQILYPWKSPEVETLTAAQPWIETHKRVLEKEADLFDPKIQQALSAGAPVWEFEKQLKKSPDWLETKNGSNEITSTMAEVGRMMGY